MKPRTDTHPVERIGNVGVESQFTITSSPQAFEILSSGIYTDPIAAVIRELSCNAYDAMVEAGKPGQPFRIHLPNKLDPYFSVSDDGIGLSDESIRGLYSSYFQSTKTNTNDQIGAFGLGSKSPFSYSKAFDVISRFDGQKRLYTVFVDETGTPAITENACNATDECNGIEVKISIRSQDYATFNTTAQKVLQYFPVKPIVSGFSDFKYHEVSSTATVTDTYIVDREYNGLIAVQGNVPYRVNQEQISNLLSAQAERFMSSHRIVLFFDIGMIDIAASREEVRYDETTAKNIANALQLAFDDYLIQLDNRLTELTKTGSKWDIFLIIRKEFGSKSNLEQLVGTNHKFTSAIANEWMISDKIEFSIDWKYHKIVPYGRGDLRAVRRTHESSYDNGVCQHYIRPHEGVQVVIQDVTKRGSMRMNTKMVRSYNSGRVKSLFAIVPVTDRMLAKLGKTGTSQDRATELAAIITQLGNPEVKLISEWTEDVAQEARAARASGHTFKLFQHASSSRRTFKANFVEAAEPTDGGVYLEIDHLRNIIIKGEPMSITSRNLNDMLRVVLRVINLSKGTNYTPSDVFGLTKKVVKYVSSNDDWECLSELYAEAIVDQTNIIEYYRRINNSNVLELNDAITKPHFTDMVKDLDTKSTFRKLVMPVILASKEADELANHKYFPLNRRDFVGELKNFERYFGINHQVKDDSFFSLKDFTPYNMIRHLNFSYESSDEDVRNYIEDARNYIELVESK